jgi:hypothetical protein
MKSKKISFKKLFFTVIAFMLLFNVLGQAAYATDEQPGADASVAGCRTTDDGVYIYIRNCGMLDEMPTVQIGTELCENVEYISDYSAQTLILLDNSVSVKSVWKDGSIDLISGLIANHGENEVIALATFADGMTVLSEYTSDYETLYSQAQGIQFANQDSYLTDILYQLLKNVKDSNEPAFTRFIVIADGADDNYVTYTQEELNEMVKSSGVSLSAIGINTGKNGEALERLFSYSRLTNGNYMMVGKKDTADAALNLLAQDNGLLCLKVTPSYGLQDGSVKEAKITLPYESGDVVLKTTMEMPFADPANAPTEEVTPEPTPEPTAAPTATPTPVPTETPADEGEENAGGVWIIILVVAAVLFLVLVAVVIVLIVVIKKKKEKERDAWRYLPPKEETAPSGNTANLPARPSSGSFNSRTDANPVNSAGRTAAAEVPLWNASSAKKCFIILMDESSSKEYRKEITGTLVIGRSPSNDIVIDSDPSVSGRHCEIIKRNEDYYLKDLNSSNGTSLNGNKVTGEVRISSGCIIGMGLSRFRFTTEVI